MSSLTSAGSTTDPPRATRCTGSVNSARRLAGGHPDVHDGQIRGVLEDQRQQPRGVDGLTRDGEPRFLRQLAIPSRSNAPSFGRTTRMPASLKSLLPVNFQ
jgi:hypothetical protein